MNESVRPPVIALDGPRLMPEGDRPPRQLVVLLHGFGASGDDLIGLAEAWRDILPDAAFIAPHAPEGMPFADLAGRQWFALQSFTPDELWRGVRRAGPLLDALIDQELARVGLSSSDLALVGFSQGTMMALHVGVRRRIAPAAIVGFSGIIAGPEHLGEEIQSRPPILLVHGDQDEVIPAKALALTRDSLAAAQVVVEWHIRPGLGHGIDPVGLAMGGGFLRQAFGVRR
ncbi:MAG: dienelactone hydrolase family protein [Hyphomicrobiaceae bacterium]